VWTDGIIAEVLDRQIYYFEVIFVSGVFAACTTSLVMVLLRAKLENEFLALHSVAAWFLIMNGSFYLAELLPYCAIPRILTGGRQIGGFLPTADAESELVEGPWSWPCVVHDIVLWCQGRCDAGWRHYFIHLEPPLLLPLPFVVIVLGSWALVHFVEAHINAHGGILAETSIKIARSYRR
jgi:hypothetical protein